MKLFKTLLSLRSIKLVLISVCAITYLALTSIKTSENAVEGKMISVPAVSSVNEENEGGGLTISENLTSISDIAAVTTRTGQRLKFPLRRARAVSLDQTVQKMKAANLKYGF